MDGLNDEELRSTCQVLPPGLCEYPHQIAGHGLMVGRKAKVLYRAADHSVFKPVQAFPKGRQEIDFYRHVFNPHCSDPALLELRPFIPAYRGLFHCAQTDTYYICLEDVLAGMLAPSVIDIKIGRISYAPDATLDKVATELSKYAHRDVVGFLITGMKVQVPGLDTFKFLDRMHGRFLDPEMVYHQGLRLFLGRDDHRACSLATSFLTHLRDILSWFERQSQLAFYASSLLLAYDVTTSVANGSSNSQSNHSGGAAVVRWVDFTHTVDTGGKQDENFLFGLRSLIGYLERVVRDTASQ